MSKQKLARLYIPKQSSHKGQNGVLLVVGGSKTFHGAPITAIKAASKIVDLVYFYSPEKENNALVEKIKLATADVIVLTEKQVFEKLGACDCVLIGPGLKEDKKNKKLANNLLKKFSKKVVLDAGALVLADRRQFKNRAILTPHANEFKKIFHTKPAKQNAKIQAKKNNCVILLKGKKDVVTDGKNVFVVSGGNAGMTKGGTGDCLAGMVAAFACKNGLLPAAFYASKANKKAGELLFKKQGHYYSASDLVEELPKALKKSS